MATVDELNRFGRDSLALVGASLKRERQAWGMKQNRLTPGYTAVWEDMPIARAQMAAAPLRSQVFRGTIEQR